MRDAVYAKASGERTRSVNHMKYFGNFVQALSPTDLAPIETRAYATDGPELTFAHLDDRAFEVLTYRLLSKRGASTNDRVTLMQGVGERGRDVVSYGADGRLKSIAQCKLFRERLSYPDLVRELVKLALHRFLDPEVIRPGVTYEVWAPGGFTEPAAQLVDTWPHGWTEEKLEPFVRDVINEYTAFKGLSWEVVRESLRQFASLVQVKKLSGVEISLLVRGTTEIFADFFIAKYVVDVQTLRRELKSALAEEREAAASQGEPEATEQTERGKAPTAPPSFFQARPVPPAFTGRDSTLAAARIALTNGRLLVLAGAGGIGKSTIALRLAADAVAAGRATYWLDGSRLDQQLAMLAFMLGATWTATNVEPLVKTLESLQACIIIDGLAFTPDVRGIPGPSSHVSVIATTRERGIVPLLPYGAELIDVSVLSPSEARQLLRLLVGVPFSWTDEELDEIADICGYLPLALVLVASALRKNTVSGATFIKELRASPITTLDSNATYEQPGIRRTFAIALAGLSPQERSALIGLSVCAPGSWADVVAFVSQQPVDVTERALSALQAVSLVERHPVHPLWEMHDVLRYMSLEQPDAREFAFRHAVSAMRQVEIYRRPEDWAYLEANLGQILVAAERLAKGGLAVEVGATIRELVPHLREREMHGSRNYVIKHLAEQLLPLLPKKSLSRAYYIGQLGVCAVVDGNDETGEQLLEESRKLYKALGARSGEVSTIANMAHLDEERGNLDRAAKRFEQAADELQIEAKKAPRKQKLDWRRQSLVARWNLARVEARRGKREHALKILDIVLRASMSADLRDIHGRATWYKARVLAELKRYSESLELGREAVRELGDAGLASELLHALLEFAETALLAGFPTNALQAAEHATRLAEGMEDFEELSVALTLKTCAFMCMDKELEATKTRAAAHEAARLAPAQAATLERVEALEARVVKPPAAK